MPYYSVKELTVISGVSARTLHYYDEIGLLKPYKIDANGYRIYSDKECDLLHTIMIYKELGFELKQIKNIINSKNFDLAKALSSHLQTLSERKAFLEDLILHVKKTLTNIEGGTSMSNKEKFELFKEKMIQENEKKYGSELNEKYDKKDLEDSLFKFKNMSEEDFKKAEDLRLCVNNHLKIAMENGIDSVEAKKVYEEHKEWIKYYWGNTKYSSQAHKGLAAMYVMDERFTEYYDKNVQEGATVFLKMIIDKYAQ